MQFVKKIFFGIALFFLACTLFHTQILGLAARVALKVVCDCELAYRSLSWDEGELVFSDLVLFDPSFHTHIQRASLRMDWSAFPKKIKGHLTIDSPHLSIAKKRTLSSLNESWFDLSLSVNNGTLDWGGPVYFSLDHQSTRSQLDLNWNDASAFLTFEQGRVEGELKNFNVSLLKQWIPYGEILEGRVTGRIAVDREGMPLSANLKVAHLGVALRLGGIDGLGGTFSFNANVGAKWDLQGIGKAQDKQFPFTCQGRGFFNSRWIESKLQLDDSWCQISSDGMWSFECHQLRSEQATWLQAGLAAIWPEIGEWTVLTGAVTGKAAWTESSWNARFEAENLAVQKGEYALACRTAKADLTQEGGSVVVAAQDYDVKLAGMWEDWNAEARIGSINLLLHGGWDGEKLPILIEKGTLADLEFSGDGWIDPNFDLSFALDGKWTFLQKQIPFHCPNFSKKGADWTFDFRCIRKTWDLFRLVGIFDGKEIAYDEKSHLLGTPLSFTKCPLGDLDVSLHLPWKAILSAGPFLKEWGLDLKKIPVSEMTHLHFQLKRGQVDLLAHGEDPLFAFHAVQNGEDWEFDLQSDLSVQCGIKKDGSIRGKGSWKTAFGAEFDGKIAPSLHCEFSLSKIEADLKLVDMLEMEGRVEGQGHFIYNGEIESDFDLAVSSLAIQSHPLENDGQVHLYYSSAKGALFQGINLHGQFDCIIDLLEYDTKRSHWIFHNAQVHLPGAFLTHKFLQFLDKERDLNFTADLDFASDFSTFVCTMREGDIPFNGAYHRIEHLDLSWNHGKCQAALDYLGHYHRLYLQIDDQITGRLILGAEETPLTIDWEYTDALFIQSIEGSFSGVDAAFHAESPNMLVGSAHVDFTALSKILPPDVAQVFDEIKMGKGYELKGRLKWEKNRPFFRGLLSGKAIELFSFQFRTLLAEVDLGPEFMRIYNVKISDSAGMMKIDEIVLEGKDNKPWTISIPTLTILEMRPSLLQRPGGTVGPIDPLVVRELKVTDFKGLLDEGKSWTAKGKAHFINSYKRGESIFDLPANMLSRIVGLDLELLIPVTGDLLFEIKDGYINLLELSNAYSEGKRSQFFLEMDPSPRMDLDGNLQIFIKMKQFVLLKITESLLISIDGVLDDPQVHLKKKRFFGLM
jgi:hypothetical protein